MGRKGQIPWNRGSHIKTNNALAVWRENGGRSWNTGKRLPQKELYTRRRTTVNQYRRSTKGLYSRIKGNSIKRGWGKIQYKYEDFLAWYGKQLKGCYYCNVPESLLSKWERRQSSSYRFTIDRKDNNTGYVLSNMVFACDRCNFLKSDIFTEGEFRKIAQEYIKPKWEKLNNSI